MDKGFDGTMRSDLLSAPLKTLIELEGVAAL